MAQKADKVRRKPSAVEVPAKGEDPAERKRVLNVLAQRRYRQRRKEHVKKLEAQNAKHQLGDQTNTMSPVPMIPPIASLPDATTSNNSDTVSWRSPETLIEHESKESPIETSVALESLQDDTFSMFDPSFVAFPGDLQIDWDSARLPSLPQSPMNSSSDADQNSLSPPSCSSDSVYSFPDEAYLPML